MVDHASSVEWRPVQGFYAYEVSSDGQVRKKSIVGRNREKPVGYILKQSLIGRNKKGIDQYFGVSIYKGPEENITRVCVHVLVCTAFHGPRPTSNHQAAHSNGVSTDNRSENLSWKTPKENCADRTLHGNSRSNAKITCEQAIQIKSFIRDGIKTRHIAEKMKTTVSIVYMIKCGHTWRDV